jgi:hypothetical protein
MVTVGTPGEPPRAHAEGAPRSEQRFGGGTRRRWTLPRRRSVPSSVRRVARPRPSVRNSWIPPNYWAAPHPPGRSVRRLPSRANRVGAAGHNSEHRFDQWARPLSEWTTHPDPAKEHFNGETSGAKAPILSVIVGGQAKARTIRTDPLRPWLFLFWGGWWSRAVLSAEVGDQLLNLFFRDRFAEGRHLPRAVEDTVGNPFVGPVLLFADFGNGRSFFCAFEVGPMTAGAVVAEKNGTCLFGGLGIRDLGRAGCDESKKKDGKDLEFHESIFACAYYRGFAGAAGSGGTARILGAAVVRCNSLVLDKRVSLKSFGTQPLPNPCVYLCGQSGARLFDGLHQLE